MLAKLFPFLFKKNRSLPLPLFSEPEMASFAGDNQNDTQLDLAQAYVELYQYEKAKQLLKTVITSGNAEQIAAARQMFAELLKKERKLCSV